MNIEQFELNTAQVDIYLDGDCRQSIRSGQSNGWRRAAKKSMFNLSTLDEKSIALNGFKMLERLFILFSIDFVVALHSYSIVLMLTIE